jgi:hypothetical protein
MTTQQAGFHRAGGLFTLKLSRFHETFKARKYYYIADGSAPAIHHHATHLTLGPPAMSSRNASAVVKVCRNGFQWWYNSLVLLMGKLRSLLWNRGFPRWMSNRRALLWSHCSALERRFISSPAVRVVVTLISDRWSRRPAHCRDYMDNLTHLSSYLTSTKPLSAFTPLFTN